jgi:tRNA threonylcarbamoyladenosine dehydratase
MTTPVSTDWLDRSRRLLGADAMARLAKASVTVFGLGGVGGMCVETLARSGLGSLLLVDVDTISETNLNRQFLTTRPDLGRVKSEVAAERILTINPDCRIVQRNDFFNSASADSFFDPVPDIVVDAIDGLNAKAMLLQACLTRRIPVISTAGAGRRLDPTCVTYAPLPDVSGDRLTSRLRRSMRKNGYGPRLHEIMTVYSTELPLGGLFEEPEDDPVFEGRGRPRVPLASFATVPAAAGIAAAYLVVNRIIRQ